MSLRTLFTRTPAKSYYWPLNQERRRLALRDCVRFSALCGFALSLTTTKSIFWYVPDALFLTAFFMLITFLPCQTRHSYFPTPLPLPEPVRRPTFRWRRPSSGMVPVKSTPITPPAPAPQAPIPSAAEAAIIPPLPPSAYLRQCEGYENYTVPEPEPKAPGPVRKVLRRMSSATVEAFKLPEVTLPDLQPLESLKRVETAVGESLEELTRKTVKQTKKVFKSKSKAKAQPPRMVKRNTSHN